MLKGQDVLVLGAGIGGLAVSIALANRGANVQIIEQSPAITEVGAGLQISPNGVAVLDALGLGDALRAAAVRAGAVNLCDYRRGAPVLRLDLATHAPELDFLFLHRADLVDILAERASAVGVDIRLNCVVQHVIPNPNGNVVQYADGSKASHPLVVGADGLHSPTRTALNGASKPFFTGQAAWRALVPADGIAAPEVAVHMGPGCHLVTYPLRGGSLINIVAVREQTEWLGEGWNQPGDPAELRAAFSGFSAEIRGLLDRVDTVNLWGLFRHPVARHWAADATAILGDAAHPTLPFLAQGANLALEDAWVLADCLNKMPAAQALRSYQALRRPRASNVIQAANANARNYHLRNPLIRASAHAALRLGGRIAPARALSRFDWIYRHDVTNS